MAFKKIEKFNRLINFEETPVIEGFPIGLRDGMTKYGDAQFLEMQLKETGETVSVALGAALQGFDWEDMIGELVRIVFEGEEESKNHKGKSYNVFSVYVDKDYKFEEFCAPATPPPAPPAETSTPKGRGKK